jgi:hypothetical protein
MAKINLQKINFVIYNGKDGPWMVMPSRPVDYCIRFVDHQYIYEGNAIGYSQNKGLQYIGVLIVPAGRSAPQTYIEVPDYKVYNRHKEYLEIDKFVASPSEGGPFPFYPSSIIREVFESYRAGTLNLSMQIPRVLKQEIVKDEHKAKWIRDNIKGAYVEDEGKLITEKGAILCYKCGLSFRMGSPEYQAHDNYCAIMSKHIALEPNFVRFRHERKEIERDNDISIEGIERKSFGLYSKQCIKLGVNSNDCYGLNYENYVRFLASVAGTGAGVLGLINIRKLQAIAQRYGGKLSGWPEDVTFASKDIWNKAIEQSIQEGKKPKDENILWGSIEANGKKRRATPRPPSVFDGWKV